MKFMRLNIAALICLTLLWSPFAIPGPTTALTVAQVFDEIDVTIEQAERSANVVVQQMGAQMKQALAQIKLDFVDVLDHRVNELSKEMQLQLRSIQMLGDQTLESVNTLPACIGNEVQFATSALRDGVESSLSRIPFVASGKPAILLVHEHSLRRPFVVRADPKSKLLVVRGVNLWSEQEMCSVDASLTPLEGVSAAKVPLEVVSTSSGEYVLRAGDGIASGAYKVTLGGTPRGPGGSSTAVAIAKRLPLRCSRFRSQSLLSKYRRLPTAGKRTCTPSTVQVA